MAGGTGYFWAGASEGISEGMDWHRKIFDLKEKKKAREELDEHKRKVASDLTEAARLFDEYHKMGNLTEDQERSLYAAFHGLTTEVQQQYQPVFQNIVDGNFNKINEQKEMISSFFGELMPMIRVLSKAGNLDAVLGLIDKYITHPEARIFLDSSTEMAKELQSVRDLMADERHASFNSMMQGMILTEVKIVDGKETLVYKPESNDGTIDLERAMDLKDKANQRGHDLKITNDGKWELTEKDVPKGVFEGYMRDPQATAEFMDTQERIKAKYKPESAPATEKPRDFKKDSDLEKHIKKEIQVEQGIEAYAQLIDQYENIGYDIPDYMKETNYFAKIAREEYEETIKKLRTYAKHIEDGVEFDSEGFLLEDLYREYTDKAIRLIELLKEFEGRDIDFPLKTIEEYYESKKPGAVRRVLQGIFPQWEKKGTFEK